MKPIKFKEENVIYGNNQSQYLPLPALKCNDEYGSVITCWKMNLKERILALFTGKIWVNEASFNKSLTPIFLKVSKKDMIKMR